MSQADNTPGRQEFAPPSPAELMAKYLQRQAGAHAAGLATAAVVGEVQPYEAGPVQPIDARLAWQEALDCARFFGVREAESWKAPAGWASLVQGYEPVFDLALCVGNFPQLVRNLFPLMQAGRLAELRRAEGGRAVAALDLVGWVKKTGGKGQPAQSLVAVGVARLAREYDLAAQTLAACESAMPAAWRDVWANEQAALAWHAGRAEEAYRAWQGRPDSTAVLFNRGMAALFLDRPAEAQPPLAEAVGRLPESSAWHHLGRLYLTLARTRK